MRTKHKQQETKKEIRYTLTIQIKKEKIIYGIASEENNFRDIEIMIQEKTQDKIAQELNKNGANLKYEIDFKKTGDFYPNANRRFLNYFSSFIKHELMDLIKTKNFDRILIELADSRIVKLIDFQEIQLFSILTNPIFNSSSLLYTSPSNWFNGLLKNHRSKTEKRDYLNDNTKDIEWDLIPVYGTGQEEKYIVLMIRHFQQRRPFETEERNFGA